MSQSALAFDADANPVIAWNRSPISLDEPSQIHLRRWNGLDWVEVGDSDGPEGASATDFDSSSPAVAVSVASEVGLAWTGQQDASRDVYVQVYRDSRWQGLDGSTADGGLTQSAGVAYDYATSPQLSFAANGPVATYLRSLPEAVDGLPMHSAWTGSQWDTVAWLDGSATDGGVSNSHAASTDPSIAVHPSGRLCVSWTEVMRHAPRVMCRCADLRLK